MNATCHTAVQIYNSTLKIAYFTLGEEALQYPIMIVKYVHGYVRKYARVDLHIYVSSIQLRGDKKMVVTKPAEFRMNQKEYFQKAYGGESVVVSRPGNENVIVINQESYDRVLKLNRLMMYYLKMKGSGKLSTESETSMANVIRGVFEGTEENAGKILGYFADDEFYMSDDFDETPECFKEYI